RSLRAMPSTAGTSCTSSITTKNSSPPSRATKSLARRTVRSRRATSTSSPSPISWPCASLICLKPSRSMNTPASLAPRRRGRSRLEHPAQLAPAGLARAGDGIDVVRPVHHLREAVLRVGLPEEVRGHLHQAAEAKLALALRFLRLFSLEELADLAADDARGLHQALVGLAHRLARE